MFVNMTVLQTVITARCPVANLSVMKSYLLRPVGLCLVISCVSSIVGEPPFDISA